MKAAPRHPSGRRIRADKRYTSVRDRVQSMRLRKRAQDVTAMSTNVSGQSGSFRTAPPCSLVTRTDAYWLVIDLDEYPVCYDEHVAADPVEFLA